MSYKRLLTTAMSLSILWLGLPLPKALEGGVAAKEVVNRSVATSTSSVVSVRDEVVDLRTSSVPRSVAYPLNSFWDKLAQCETGGDWSNGGRYAGGLGIMTSGKFGESSMGSWERFGGEQFAPSPDKATREQQIIVANRIAVEGWRTVVHRDPDKAKRMGVPVTYVWDREAVGFTGWGCYKSKSTGKYRMAKPKLFYYANHAQVVLFKFEMNETSKAVHDLQMILGVKVDSFYGPKTKAAHVKYLKKHKLSLSGVPGISVVKETAVKRVGLVSSFGVRAHDARCPKWEGKLREYGLPVKDFSAIMYRESRCIEKVIGWNYKAGTSHKNCKLAPAEAYKKCYAVRSYDSGLLQINSSWVTVTSQVCKAKRGNLTVLLNADCNLRVAKYLYENGGLAHWKATSGRG